MLKNKLKYKKMNKPVLVLAMSEKCGACLQFKRKMLPELEKELNDDPRIKFVVLDFPEMLIPQNLPGVNYHPELRNGFVRFFPTFILFPGNLWNNHKSKLKGEIKHGDEAKPRPDYSKPSIFSWIDETLKTPLFSNDTQIEKIKTKGTLSKSLNNGKYVVPTVGTYNRFKNTRLDESEL
jgi:thiol-disulfide isomerase/thioredoxin